MNGVNDPPVAQPILEEYMEQTGPHTIDVLRTVVDVDGGPIVITEIVRKEGDVGGITQNDTILNINTNFYDLLAGENETIVYDVVVNDGIDDADPITVTIIIMGVSGGAPIVVTVTEDTDNVTIPDLPDDITSIIIKQDPDGGVFPDTIPVTIDTNKYELPEGEIKNVFVELCLDSDCEFKETLQIIVEGVNDPPVAEPFTHTMTEGTGTDMLDVLTLTNAFDLDPGDNELFVSSVEFSSGGDPFENNKIDVSTNSSGWAVDSDKYAYLNEGETETTVFNIIVEDKNGGQAPVVTGTITIVGVGRCEVTTEKFGDLAKELITSEGITDEATLNDPDSYQAAAFKWLVEEDTYALSCPQDPNPECLIIQRYVLATLYFGTNGNNWTDCGANGIDFEPDSCEASVNGAYSPGGNTTWLSRVNECAWGLLACVPETGCVDRIEMERNNVVGTIPSEMGNLDQLRFLYLERGGLSGSIPNELGNITTLQVLDLDFNDLTGTIPESIFSNNNLGQLDLNNNFLSGTISAGILNSQDTLNFIQLHNNLMTGTIPEEVGASTLLRVAQFSGNNFTGSMPDSLCLLDALNITGTTIMELLDADCDGDPPEVFCDCCNQCGGVDIPVPGSVRF
uniref:RapA2 cadherin-like domain-containing protein n=1 Tax=Attheya septentrionalis TaxID=420275 RepID=A0A7S2XRA3_9STRA